MLRAKRSRRGFALYEVLLGVTIFVVGVLTLGRSVENVMNANALADEEGRVRQILANRMAEIQAKPGQPDPAHETKIDTGYGVVRLVEKALPAALKNDQGFELGGIIEVTLTVDWIRAGVPQSKQLVFYVYRAG
jgi:hypothetical protein